MKFPTLEDVINDQKDLSALCADRILDSNEIFPGNSFYGNDIVLKTYTGIPINHPLKFIIPHGIVFSDKYLWQAEITSTLPAIMCYQENRRPVYKKEFKNRKRIIEGAAPFIYIPDIIDGYYKNERKGTIFFPAHSTHHITTTMDYEQLANKLLELGHQYKPVVVCMYWRDVILGHHQPFQRKGIKIVSAGHIYDPMFLFRLFHLCSQYEFSGCNKVGSHLFFAQYAGCKHFCINSGDIHTKADKNILDRDSTTNCSKWDDKITDLYSFPPTNNTNYKKIVLDKYLGLSFKKSKQELKQIIINCDSDFTASKNHKKSRTLKYWLGLLKRK